MSSGLRGWQPTPPTAGSLQGLICHHGPHHLPGVTGRAGACLGEGGVSDPPGLSSYSASRLSAGFACVCAEGGQGQGDGNRAQDVAAGEGFLPFCIFVIREKRNFYGYFYGWSVPRTWSICFTNSPLPASLGVPGTITPADWRDSARQPLWLCQHHFVPSPLWDSWSRCPLPSHHAAPHVSRCRPPAWRPSAPCSRAGAAARPPSALLWDPAWSCPLSMN